MKEIKICVIFCAMHLLYLWIYTSENGPKKIYLNMEQAINRALILNRGLQNEMDNLLNAQFSLIAARSQFQFKIQPHLFTNFSGSNGLGGGLQVSKKFSFGASLSINTAVQKSAGNYNSGLDVILTQPLLKGLSTSYNRFGVKQAEYSLETAERSLYLTRVSVILETVSALYDILRKEKILQLQESSYKRSRGYAEAAKIKQKKGFATALDVYRANIQLKQAETLLVNSREQYRDARDNLKIILTIPMEQEIRITAPLTYENIQLKETYAIKSALENRRELKQYHDMISNLELQTRISRHNILPQMDLELRYSTNGTAPGFINSFNADKGKVEVRLNSSREISNTVDRMEYRRSKIALKSAERMLSLRRDEIKRQVKNSLRNLRRLEKNIKIQKEEVHQSRGKLELSKVKFSHGMADNFDLIESETQYRQAEVGYISSVIEYIIGTYRLKAVMGILLEDHGFKTSTNRK